MNLLCFFVCVIYLALESRLCDSIILFLTTLNAEYPSIGAPRQMNPIMHLIMQQWPSTKLNV